MAEFTPDQRRVIEHGEGNLLVSAAAGSGKTTVLVERILRLVRGGADIASFLVVTFTRAAADELRERLLLRLEAEAEESEAMRAQMERVPLAAISTIHAFCYQLLTRYFEKAGVEPSLRICSEAERVILHMRALDATLDEMYQSEDMLRRLERMGGVRQVRLNVESLHKFLLCQPDPLGFLERSVQDYAKNAPRLGETAWLRWADGQARCALARVEERVAAALRFARESAQEDCRKMAALIEDDLARVRAYLAGEGERPEFAVWRSPGGRKAGSSADLGRLRQARDAYKEALSQAEKEALPVNDWTRRQYEEMADPLDALAQVTRRFMEEFSRLKAEMGVVDYNDLEQMALRLTQDAGVCEDLRLQYRYVFVDEYQDSSAVQEEILSRVARGDNTFHVGDVKQSIYGFRQSEPGLFLAEQSRYLRGEGGELIALNRNYRSLPNVLRCINRVFERCMTRESAGMDYDAAARLYPGREGGWPGAPTLVALLDKKAEAAEEDSAGQTPVRREAEAVAGLVRRLVGTPIADPASPSGTRPARYGDIVVLRRQVSSALATYLECFAKQGIPVYSSKGGSFYETLEISQVMDYLWAVHNPLEDVHLLGALRGVGGFTAQELARIRLNGRKEGGRVWNDLIRAKTEFGQEPLGRKAGAFIDQLQRMRRIAREESVAALCAVVLEETGILSRFALMPRGQIRVGNLRSLPVRAAEYDQAGLRLGDFLRRIAATGSRNREEDVPAFSQEDDVVRIMTVHQSKGLEFPIVIGAGLGAKFRFTNDRDADGYLTSRVWCDRECGLALEYYDPESAAGDQTLMTRAIAARRKKESVAEEMRILYVLMTRARERLALVGEVADLEGRMRAWESGGEEAGCMLDWIMPAVLTHPDAAPLRAAYGIAVAQEPDDSLWEVTVQSVAEAAQQDAAQEPDLTGLKREENQPDEELLGQMRFVYPHGEGNVLQKQSVTELAHGPEETFFVREKPAFLNRERKLTGAARGSALHRFMEIVDFTRLKSGDARGELKRQAEQAVASARITPEQGEAVLSSLEELMGFLRSPIGSAILEGAPVLREKPFELRLDQGGQMRLVQGVIDLVVCKEDGAILVDYKTDHEGLDPESVRARHGAQVRLYAEAARRAGLSVRRSVVYLFYTGGIVEIPPECGEEG